MKLRLTKSARLELDETVAWLNAKRAGFGEQLLVAVGAAFEQILQDPEQFPRVEVELTGSTLEWRRVLLKRLSHIIVYHVTGDTIVIAAITHTSRDWTSRLSDKEQLE